MKSGRCHPASVIGKIYCAKYMDLFLLDEIKCTKMINVVVYSSDLCIF